MTVPRRLRTTPTRARRAVARREAGTRGVSVAQPAIAWVLARGEDILPLVGARTRNRLAEALGALDVELSNKDLAAIEGAIAPEAVAGERYDPRQTASLDGEKGDPELAVDGSVPSARRPPQTDVRLSAKRGQPLLEEAALRLRRDELSARL
jgi:hypothetical protein